MVSAISQAQSQALPDMMSADRFVFVFSSVPNSKNDPFTDFSIKVQAAAIPGVSQEDWQVTIAGFVRSFRGRRMFNHDIDLTFAETVDMTTHGTLRGWMEYIAGTASGNSQGYVSSYAVTASIYTFDTTGAQADVANFYRIRPITFPNTTLSGENTVAMQTSCTFRFDYCNFKNTPEL